MAKIIKTRIRLKYDTLTNWEAKGDIVLLAGEVAIATGVDLNTEDNVNTSYILMKVGDGSTTFESLPWVSALAADVYDWAKLSWEDFLTKLGNSGFDLSGYKKTQTPVAAQNLSGATVFKSISQNENGEITVATRVLTAADLGLTKIMNFLGTSSTAIAQGSTTNPITINGESVTAENGDVVLYGTKEFVWDGSKWQELGDQGSHALKSIQIIAGNGLTGGGDLSENRTLNVGAGNGIAVAADSISVKPGGGITVNEDGVHHADTSNQASVTANGRQYITGVTLDTFGHVTGLTTGTETVENTWRPISINDTVIDNVEDTLSIKSGEGLTITKSEGDFIFSVAAPSATQNGYLPYGWYDDLNNFVSAWRVDTDGTLRNVYADLITIEPNRIIIGQGGGSTITADGLVVVNPDCRANYQVDRITANGIDLLFPQNHGGTIALTNDTIQVNDSDETTYDGEFVIFDCGSASTIIGEGYTPAA